MVSLSEHHPGGFQSKMFSDPRGRSMAQLMGMEVMTTTPIAQLAPAFFPEPCLPFLNRLFAGPRQMRRRRECDDAGFGDRAAKTLRRISFPRFLFGILSAVGPHAVPLPRLYARLRRLNTSAIHCAGEKQNA